jgi:DNA-binding transcriptional MerR regulator
LKKKKTAGPEIPAKKYFRIGEVSKIAGLPPHTLRYWETEFKNLAPQKAGTGQRIYTRADLETVLLLKKLLHEQRFTIEGARQHLKQAKAGAPAEADARKSRPGSDRQLGFGFTEIKLKEQMKKLVRELRAIEKSLRSE